MAKPPLRCAVYTRKSTEDGLEQEFNSLDAQYEACSSYALSQRHEGWILNDERYDDGGFSGGNINRPGLKRLLADVAAGNVDNILVYKIDRLTRSLSDFARIVDVLDKAGASFVSITQSFNTTTSMGRLTLNMLLSFAQFEREVTGERIRDKIAASKRKGIWMGGPVPLGYDVDNRKLVANETEAKLIRHIMRRYIALGSVVELVDELSRDGHRTKIQHRTNGPPRGGCKFSRGMLYLLLTNRIYRGMIVHKGEAFEGEHHAIVPQELWDEVQSALTERASGGARRLGAANPSLLAGMLTDGEGRAMTPSHATKPGKRYRYYITRPQELGGTSSWRVSAYDLEAIVCQRLAQMLSKHHVIADLLNVDSEPLKIEQATAAGAMAAQTLRSGTANERLTLLAAMEVEVTLKSDAVELIVMSAPLMKALEMEPDESLQSEPITLTCPATRVWRNRQMRLIIPGAVGSKMVPSQRDEKLVALVAEAYSARNLMLANPGLSIIAVAAKAGKCRTRLRKLLPIGCLAPDIVTAIIEGRQPTGLNSKSLLAVDLPYEWVNQRSALGFS